MLVRDWPAIHALLEANLTVIWGLPPAEPMPKAEFCRESVHRMLGHLTACQMAWLPILRALDAGEPHVEAEHPVKLYKRLKLAEKQWPELLCRFEEDRSEWQRLVDQVDPERTVKTQSKSYDTRMLTRRLVLHESAHLAEHGIA